MRIIAQMGMSIINCPDLIQNFSLVRKPKVLSTPLLGRVLRDSKPKGWPKRLLGRVLRDPISLYRRANVVSSLYRRSKGVYLPLYGDHQAREREERAPKHREG
jgi:hypothetical protein